MTSTSPQSIHPAPQEPDDAAGGGIRPIYFNRCTPPHISTLIFATGLSALSMNVFIPSLPSMAAYFEADFALIQQTITLYLAVGALVQIFAGPLSDYFGRRPVILWSCVIFLLATVGCLITSDITLFLIFRMIQSTVVACIALPRAMIRDTVPANRAASLIGYVTMGMALVPMVGPVLGGMLDQAYGWKANFSMLLVMGGALLFVMWFDLGETHHSRAPTLWRQFQDYPGLLRARRFWGYSLAAAFTSGSFFSYLGGVSLVASDHFNLNAAEIGLYFGIAPLGYMGGNLLSGLFAQRLGIITMITTGAAIALAGMVFSVGLFLIGLDHPLSLFGPMVCVGVGNGMCLPSANVGMMSVRPQLAGSASGLGGALMTAGGALMASLSGVIVAQYLTPLSMLMPMALSAFMALLAAKYISSREKYLKYSSQN